MQTAKASRKQSSLSGKESAQGCIPPTKQKPWALCCGGVSPGFLGVGGGPAGEPEFGAGRAVRADWINPLGPESVNQTKAEKKKSINLLQQVEPFLAQGPVMN